MANNFDELREVLRNMHNIAMFWQDKAEKLDAEVARLEAKNIKLEELQSQLRSENEQLSEKIEGQLNSLTDAVNSSLQNQSNTIKNSLETLLKEIRGREDNINLTSINRVINTMHDELSKSNELQAKCTQDEHSSDELNGEIANLTKKLETANQEKEKLEQKLKLLEKESEAQTIEKNNSTSSSFKEYVEDDYSKFDNRSENKFLRDEPHGM